jgi:ATP-dependent Clp protease ATP-binding subunit ClpC
MSEKSQMKIKFCEALDRFIEIRVMAQDDINKLFKNLKTTDKKSYKRLIINAVVVNYLDEIAPLIFGENNYSLFGEIAEQEIYNLCIKVNPDLDIKKVTITVESNDDARDAMMPLLDGHEKQEDDMAEKLLNMESYLRKRIVGQDNALSKVSLAIRKAHVGLKNPIRPIGVFLFCGPTGVGKTEFAKALTEFMYGDENELVRIDCSEYAQSHEYAKLIGAPPGYIGHKDGGFLTETVGKKPHSVVLFDEIEKADEKVHNLLLQIFDAGVITDNKGTKISFKNSIVIMTSNVGVTGVVEHEKAIGFGDKKSQITQDFKDKEMLKSLEKAFKPEFLNRVDEIINFRSLTREDNIEIIDIMLAQVCERLEKMGMHLVITNEMKAYLVDNGTDIKMGARPLKRAIYRYVEGILSEDILKKVFQSGDSIIPVISDKKISYKVYDEKSDKKSDKKTGSVKKKSPVKENSVKKPVKSVKKKNKKEEK